MSCCFIWKYPNLSSSLTICFFAVGLFGDCWSRHDCLMFLWPRCCGHCNVRNSLQLAVGRPPSQLLGRSCCYWELVPLCQSHFLQFNRIAPWFVISLIIHWLSRNSVCSVESEFKSMTLNHLINALEHAATMLCSEKKSQTYSNNLSKLVTLNVCV